MFFLLILISSPFFFFLYPFFAVNVVQVFYGRFFGVQYAKGLRQIFGFLLVAMASYGDGMVR